ncbi:TIGR00304 family membrane protein [Methanocaldococcus fervens]|uniref:TIGR00304 family protein n=1 Tax=Methanocaldococcus fervens (strain DSM 4213 / JCM 15782 / AG86) TaxID=573064 RepID=C7P5D1_METFA|nr:TIGR00304 family protein [Methanocaldococcus fervens]ACV25309.1 Protein of unknown function DUF131 [Methanocaldococcus fervens AG86]
MRPILIFLGIILMFIGFFIMTLGIFLPSHQEYKDTETEEDVEYSGIVMIGPIPIVFGNSPGLMMLSVLIAILMIIWIFLFAFGLKIK